MIEAVECLKCKRLHRADSESYMTVKGSILVGAEGGFIGGKDDDVSHFCRPCLVREISQKDSLIRGSHD